MNSIPNFVDLTGHKFGDLTVVERVEDYISPKGYRKSQWLCKCSCGNKKVVCSSSLSKGVTKSCGCWKSSHDSILLNDITGMKFGRLTVLNREESVHGQTRWKCKCDCGNSIIAYAETLKNGSTTSCGCLHKELISTHNLSNSRLYRIYHGIKQRCLNKNSNSYKNYGGRGIEICQEWLNDFQSFYDWAMANGYSDNLTIDRINNEGNYEPSNCRWTDWITQLNNTRRNVYLSHNNKTLTVTQWARKLNMSPSGIRKRIFLGWDMENVLSTK